MSPRVPTLQFLFPMGGLGTRFAAAGISTPKPLIPVDGGPMVHKAMSSFDELLLLTKTPSGRSAESEGQGGKQGNTADEGKATLNVRVVFVVRTEHEKEFALRSLLLESFRTKYNCNTFFCVNEDGTDPTRIERIGVSTSTGNDVSGGKTIGDDLSTEGNTEEGSCGMSVYFVMMHADTRGAAETCLLAEPALILSAPVVILDCDLYVYSSRLNEVLLAMASRGVETSATLNGTAVCSADREDTSHSVVSSSSHIPPYILSTLRGALVFFNSRAPRYSYAAVEPIDGVDLSDPKGLLTSGGRVTKTAEKIPISNCSLIGAYTFATAGWFVAAAKRLLREPINPQTGLKEYYISLLYNFLLDPSFSPEGVDGDLAVVPPDTRTAEGIDVSSSAEESKKEDTHGGSSVYVLAVPKEGYASFGTPEELLHYVEGREPYALE